MIAQTTRCTTDGMGIWYAKSILELVEWEGKHFATMEKRKNTDRNPANTAHETQVVTTMDYKMIQKIEYRL